MKEEQTRWEADPALHVVIVTHDSSDVLDACLGALFTSIGDIDHHVVVVDSGSLEPPRQIIDRHPGVRLLTLEENVGYAAAINAGARGIDQRSDLLILNPDVRLAPGSIAAMRKTLRRPGTGIAVPRLTNEAGETAHSLRRTPTAARAWGEALLGERAGRFALTGHVVIGRDAYERDTEADWATGAAMLVSGQCRAAVGSWDESYFLYSEETDYCLRARDAGYSTRLSSDAVAVHLGGDSEVSPRLWSILVHNRIRFQRRRRGRIRSLPFEAAVLLNELIRVNRQPRRLAGARAVLRPPRDVDLDRASSGSPPWVCFSAQDWWYHNRAHSDFQIMRRIAADRDVLFINSIGMRMPRPGRSSRAGMRIARKVRSILRFVRRPIRERPRFAVYSPLVIPAYESPAVRKLNFALVRLQVALVRRVVLGRADPITMVTIPTAWEVVRGQRHRRLLYNRSDKHSAFEETDQGYIGALEHELLTHADGVMYVSRSLMDEDRSITGDKASFIDHGVDLDHFVLAEAGLAHPDLATIGRPRIGFFGGIDDYVVDMALLERVAVELPDHQLVLIGDATCDMEPLTRHRNVHWLGYRPYEEIPAFGAGFDVAIMPWLQNDWIEACNPIKLKEYLALGLRVVSTPFPELHAYRGLVDVASPDEFVSAVERAASDDDPMGPETRRAAVMTSSWDAIAHRVRGIGEDH